MTAESNPTSTPTNRRVSIEVDGQVAAAADIGPSDEDGTVHATLYGEVTPMPGDAGRRLVDAVLELPHVATADRLDVTIPTADAAMVERLRERADQVGTRRAGGTVLVAGRLRHPTDDVAQAAEPSTDGGPTA